MKFKPTLPLLTALLAASPVMAQNLGAIMDEPPPPPEPPSAPLPADAEQAIQETLQLTPEEIRALKAQVARTSQALALPPGPPPRPMTSSVPMQLTPGHTPPTLFLAPGMVAQATLLDVTGMAWPIERWSVSSQGDKDTFAVNQLGVNILSVSSAKLFTVGNIAIKLKDLDTPVTITLAQGASRVVDYNKEFQLPGRGPLAAPEVAPVAASPEVSPEMYDFLDGIPPAGAQVKTLTGAPGDLWLYRQHLYLRTRTTLMSPGWRQRATASDGTTVYQLPPIPALILSDRGREIIARVQ